MDEPIHCPTDAELVEQAVAEGRVQRCPTRYVVGSMSATRPMDWGMTRMGLGNIRSSG